jgi:hypothetical protein
MLESRAEPADEAGSFFGGTFRVQFAEERQNLLVGGGDGQAVRSGNGGIKIVVELPDVSSRCGHPSA